MAKAVFQSSFNRLELLHIWQVFPFDFALYRVPSEVSISERDWLTMSGDECKMGRDIVRTVYEWSVL